MRLKINDPAKPFAVKDINDNPVQLEDFKGKKLLLSFYRYAACPLCNLRVHKVIQKMPAYSEKGLHVLAFFESPAESIKRYVGKQDAPFPIIPDPERRVYKEYGVTASWMGFMRSTWTRAGDFMKSMKAGIRPGKMEGEKAMIPADFLIGPDLIIGKAFYGKDIGDHMPFEEIDVWLTPHGGGL